MNKYDTNSSPEEKEKLKKGKMLVSSSEDNVEFRNTDQEGTKQHDNTTGGKGVQIFTSIILNILALGTGASYGIPNVLSTKLDAKECSNNGTEITYAVITDYSFLSSPFPHPSPHTTPSPHPPQQKEECPFTIDSAQKTFIATSGTIGMYCTILFAVPIVSRFGKRISLLIDCVLSVAGFLLMAFARNVTMVCLGKILLGYVSLTCRSAIQPFICEISNPSIRGFTTSLYVLCYISGQALSMRAATPSFEGWRYVSGAFALSMIICFLALLLWVHETPDWLLEKCYFDKAIKSLKFYKIDRKILVDSDRQRQTGDGREKNYEEIVELYRDKSLCVTASKKSSTASWKSIMKNKASKFINVFRKPEVYKPFILLTLMLGLVDLSGFVVMSNYSISLVEEYGYGDATFVNASDLMVIIYLTRIPNSFLAMGVLKKFKKRPLYLFVCFCLFLIMSGIIAFTWLIVSGSITKENFQGSLGLQIAPMVLFILFYATFSFGYGNIPFSLMGEIFPPYASSMANTFAFILSNLFGLVALQTALVINDNFGLHSVFFIPAGAIVASMILAGKFMPETHGLSMDEIRQIYGKKLDEEDKDRDHLEEEALPYYHELRSQMQIELMKTIKQRQSVYAWPSVGGAQAVFDLPDETEHAENSEKGVSHRRRIPSSF